MRASNLMGAGLAALTAQAITGGGDVDLAVTAMGSGQTDAYAIKGTLTKITAGASTTGATLPSGSDVGDSFMVANYSGSAKTIYPPTGGKINNGSANGGVTLSDTDAIILVALSATDYAAMIIGVTESTFLSGVTAGTVTNSKAAIYSANGRLAMSGAVVAAAGSAQGDATALTKQWNAVTGADGAKGVVLQTGVADMQVTVVNTDATHVLLVYPATGAAINSLSANVAFSVGPGRSATFMATSATQWYTPNASAGFQPSTARTSAPVTKNTSATYANVTGLSGTVVPGTYKFRAVLPSTVASGTGGIKYCFNYTTAVLSALEATAKGFTASAVAVQHTTTTTTQTDLFTQAAVVILTEIEGTFVVSTGGTIAVQMAQNTSNGSDTIALLGGSFTLERIA